MIASDWWVNVKRYGGLLPYPHAMVWAERRVRMTVNGICLGLADKCFG